VPTVDRHKKRKIRHERIRSKLKGRPNKPRVYVRKSNKHLYAQAIDDVNNETIATSSTLSPDLRDERANATVESARKVGALLAKKLLDDGITQLVFDRGGYPYHGKVKALADQMREEGLEF